MNIFHKVTMQNMLKNRTRTLVTIIGVILSTAMIMAVATFAISLQNFMVKGSEQKYGDWHVAVLDAPSGFAEKQLNFPILVTEGYLVGRILINLIFLLLASTKRPLKHYRSSCFLGDCRKIVMRSSFLHTLLQMAE